MIEPLDFSKYRSIVALTGAGISVASGLRPFRGPGGLWNEVDVLAYATAEALKQDPFKVWRFFASLRQQLKYAEPNAAHYALAKLESHMENHQNFTLITQNVDGLHQRAMSKNVIEMHGNLKRIRCQYKKCRLKPYEDDHFSLESLPTCNLCGSPLRFDIVLFGEHIQMDIQREIKKSLRSCNLFMAIGTSREVYPAAGFVRVARSYGAKTIAINVEPIESATSDFHEVYLGKAEEVLPEFLNQTLHSSGSQVAA